MPKRFWWWLWLGGLVLWSLIRFLWQTASGNSRFHTGATVAICIVHGVVLAGILVAGVIERKRRKGAD